MGRCHVISRADDPEPKSPIWVKRYLGNLGCDNGIIVTLPERSAGGQPRGAAKPGTGNREAHGLDHIHVRGKICFLLVCIPLTRYEPAIHKELIRTTVS